MAKNTYNKRMKGNWCQGKVHKGDSGERQYAKEEIKEGVVHDLEGHPTRHKKKRKRNKKASLEHTIQWYTQKIAEYERLERSSSFLNYLRHGLKQAQKKYEEEYGEDK